MKKARTTLAWTESLIFEQGSEGRNGLGWRDQDVVDKPTEEEIRKTLGRDFREPIDGLPEVTEPEVVRHYTRLSQQNLGIDTAFYPLGSCTMKYNPKVNETCASRPVWASTHPYSDVLSIQPMLALMDRLERMLGELSGMDAVSLQPAAGAQGELAGIMCIEAYHRHKGNHRDEILIPDSAHGTNPSTCAMAGYRVKEVPTGPHGHLEAETVAQYVDGKTAGIMMTNPNTLGIFEREIDRIAAVLHRVDAQVYMDGANLNALMGLVRPGEIGVDVMHFNLHKTFSTPHGGGGPGAGPIGVKAHLEPFLPIPRVRKHLDGHYFLSSDSPLSIGRVKAFYGNFGVALRAYAYLVANGIEGLRKVTRDAILNANYIKARLADRYHLPYKEPCFHEVVFTDKNQKKHHVEARHMAKALLDAGFHAPTIYFPLVVHGALMIEPTESETLETLDAFIEVMRQIADDAEKAPETLKGETTQTFVTNVDETGAARKPVLRWKPGGA